MVLVLRCRQWPCGLDPHQTCLHHVTGFAPSRSPSSTNSHDIINAHDLGGFPPAFYPLRTTVLHVRMTLPPEQPPPHHSTVPPGGSQQPNPATQATLTEHWTRHILSYARFRRLFILRVEDANTGEGDWYEVLRNPRINRAYAHCMGVFPLS